jgi:branched-chain amino acid transport system ATP-binding protein
MKKQQVLLEIRKLRKSFGGILAVSDVEFQVKEGEILGLIGPNGAGKTTLFNLISGYYFADSGAILFGGEDIGGLKPHVICRKGITRTFQMVRPFTRLSVFENVKVGAFNKTRNFDETKQRALKALEFMNLLEKRDILTGQLTLADLKRLELARALATQPTILLLDEVMAGLTPKETEDIVRLVKKIHDKGITLLIIEHVMRAIMSLSDRVIVLNQGEKIAEGTPVEVSRNERVIRSYLGEEWSGA